MKTKNPFQAKQFIWSKLTFALKILTKRSKLKKRQTDDEGNEFYWGVDDNNRAVKWVRGQGETVWVLTKAGLRQQGDGPQD